MRQLPPELLLVAAMMGGNRPGQEIEEQEAHGQRVLCESAQLPVDINPAEFKAYLESFGVKFNGVDARDPIFENVELPAGWKLKPTDHSMWNTLCDQHGLERAAIFYKAAFYDRSANMHPSCRFQVGTDVSDYKTWTTTPKIMAGAVTIWTGEPIVNGYDQAKQIAHEKLSEKFPDYENYKAYWDMIENPKF